MFTGCFPGDTRNKWSNSDDPAGRLEAWSSHSTFGIAEKGLELGDELVSTLGYGETIGEHTSWGYKRNQVTEKGMRSHWRLPSMASFEVKSEAFYKKKTASLRAKNEVQNLEESWSWIRLDVDVVVVFQHGSRVSLAGQKGSEAVGRWDEGSMTPLFWNWFDDLCLREPFGNGIFWMYSNFIIKPLIVVWIGRFLRIPQLQTTNWLFRRSWNLQDTPRTDWNESEPKGWKKKRWPWDDHQRVDELVSIQNLLKLLDEKVSCIKMDIFGWLGRLSTWQWRILKGGVAFGSWMDPFMFYRKEGRKIRILPTQSETAQQSPVKEEISCLIWYINFPNASALHFAHFCLSCWLFVWSTRQPTNAQLRLGVEAIGNQSPRIDRISWTLNLET